MGSGTILLQLQLDSPGRGWPPGAPHSHPWEPSSSTFVLGIMEPLLPETAEGSDARARPNEDARMGAVLGELEVTGTEGDRDGRRDALVLRHHGLGAHARQGLGIWGGGMVGRGSVGGCREDNELRFDSQILQPASYADQTHHHLAPGSL